MNFIPLLKSLGIFYLAKCGSGFPACFGSKKAQVRVLSSLQPFRLTGRTFDFGSKNIGSNPIWVTGVYRLMAGCLLVGQEITVRVRIDTLTLRSSREEYKATDFMMSVRIVPRSQKNSLWDSNPSLKIRSFRFFRLN